MLLFQNLTQQRFLENVRRDFISNLSHELRTPLASLKALTETLQEGALEDPPAAQRFLQRMDAEVDALSQMVSELLELARIESGRVPLQMQPLSPGDVVSNAVERLSVQAERADLEIILDCPDDLPEIFADPPRLEQVLVNLLHNAIKFTPAGGKILLTTRVADASGMPPPIYPSETISRKSGVLFSVQDTGVGIPSDDLPRIFERFYKADRARSSGGTGLGLAIARHSVEAHGGRIWAESVEGQGSTFYFYIPLA
jgi:two-component system phosphate regulon sensor histidine kinase PhoR